MNSASSETPYSGIKRNSHSVPSIVLKDARGTYTTLPYFDLRMKIDGENSHELLAEFGDIGVTLRGHRLPKLLRDMAQHRIEEIAAQPSSAANRNRETHCFVSEFEIVKIAEEDSTDDE